MWPNFVAVISLMCLAFIAWAKAGPVPIVNEVSARGKRIAGCRAMQVSGGTQQAA